MSSDGITQSGQAGYWRRLKGGGEGKGGKASTSTASRRDTVHSSGRTEIEVVFLSPYPRYSLVPRVEIIHLSIHGRVLFFAFEVVYIFHRRSACISNSFKRSVDVM